MKVINYNNGSNTYEHNGVTFKCTYEVIVDALSYYDINLLSYIEKKIDELIAINLSADFSVICKIRKSFSNDHSEVTSSISVIKIAKYVD